MRDDHVLLENGQPIFPFGFYNVSWRIPAEERLAMVRDVAKWGYNTVHVGMRNDEYDGDRYGAFLDACAKLGIRVITEFAESKAESVVRKYRGKAAVMGWNPGDEREFFTLSELFFSICQLSRRSCKLGFRSF